MIRLLTVARRRPVTAARLVAAGVLHRAGWARIAGVLSPLPPRTPVGLSMQRWLDEEEARRG